MGFLGFGRPKWKHADAEVRLRAVADLEGQQGVLRDLALGDADARVRAAAASRVTDATGLQEMAARGDDAVKRIARERLSGVAERLLRTKPLSACGAIFDSVNDQKSLADLSLNAQDAAVRAAAFAKMIAAPEPSQALLTTIAIQDARGEIGLKAVERIERRGMLRDIARKAKHQSVRAAAQARAERVEADAGKPSPEQSRKARLRALEPLMPLATRLVVSSDLDKAESEWTSLERQWREALALGGDVPLEDAAKSLDERFTRMRREAVTRREDERQRTQAGIRAREALLAELAAMAPVDSADAVRVRTELLARWSALGPLARAHYAPLESRFRAELERLCPATGAFSAVPASSASGGMAVSMPAAPIAVSPEHASELEAIGAEAERLSTADDFRETMQHYHQLHKRWLNLAGGLPDSHPLKARFTAAYATFKDRWRAARESRQAAYGERTAQLQALVAEAEELVPRSAQLAADDQVGLRDMDRAIRDLQARWKSVGSVKPQQALPLRTRFRAACDAAYAPVAASREAEDWVRFANLAKAEQLIAQVGALATSEDFAAIAGTVKRAHQAWKDCGPLPRERQLDAWQRFKTACDAQFERCRPYFAELDAARVGNLDKKRALVAEAEALSSHGPVGLAGSPADLAAKRAATERFKAVQEEWRAIGPVPREHDREIWKRFRAACDTFYQHRHTERAAERDEEQANLVAKQALCAQVEEFAVTAESAKAQNRGLLTPSDVMRRAKDLQQRWKAIGHVPRDQVEALWTRFRGGMDRVYETISEHRDAENAERIANLEKKRALIKEVEEILAHENPRWFKDEVRELQKKWRDIGHIPRENMDEVNDRFATLCRKVMASEQQGADSK